MTSNKTVADVFNYLEDELPGILEGISRSDKLASHVCVVVQSATNVHLAVFSSQESMEACPYGNIPVTLPVFTNECLGIRLKICVDLAKEASKAYAQTVHNKASALLTQLDDAAMMIYKQLLDLKLAQGLDIDTIIDQIDGEHALHSSQLDELYDYLESN